MSNLIIELNDIHQVYHSEGGIVHALKGVSLSVSRGEFLCIMGPSGSGKSTLMNILGCLDIPVSGTYQLAGIDISTLNDDEIAFIRATKIGFVFQSFNLLQKTTVLRNVMLPLTYTGISRKQRLEKAVAALVAAGLPPKYYQHRANELSGGQMQRVAIARALVNEPDVIFADEPTGNLDSATGEMVLNTFQQLKSAGRTIVLITHDRTVADWADRIVFIRDGMMYSETDYDSTQLQHSNLVGD